MKSFIRSLAIAVIVIIFASTVSRTVSASDCTRTSVGLTPLSDLGSGTYLGFSGGLYPGGTNVMPADHLNAGLARSAQIRPLDAAGNPSPSGKYVLLSIGMSNTSNEFCAPGTTTNCTPEAFMPQAAADPLVNHSSLVIVNGAQGGQDAQAWTSSTANTYNVVRDQRLLAFGLTEAQVQAVWLKAGQRRPELVFAEFQCRRIHPACEARNDTARNESQIPESQTGISVEQDLCRIRDYDT